MAVAYILDRQKEVVSADLGIMPEESKDKLRAEAENVIRHAGISVLVTPAAEGEA